MVASEDMNVDLDRPSTHLLQTYRDQGSMPTRLSTQRCHRGKFFIPSLEMHWTAA